MRLVECSFLIPILRNSDRNPHQPRCWSFLQDELLATFAGFTGPRKVFAFKSAESGQGAWRDANDGIVEDESRSYTIAVPIHKVAELRSILGRTAEMFDQECIYFSVRGEVEFVSRVGEPGY
jgi:hypothetical protein